MNDLISRQDAIDMRFSCGMQEDGFLYVRYAEVMKHLKTLQSVKPEQHWIPVSERLPEEDGTYLITGGIFGQRIVFTAQYNCKTWCVKTNVYAWMPLPEPYGRHEE